MSEGIRDPDELSAVAERVADELASAVVDAHRVTPLPRVSRELRERLVESVKGAVRDADVFFQAATGRAPQLIPDEAGAPILLKLRSCDECGSIENVDGRGNCSEHPDAGTSWVDYPVRKLPEGFSHLQSTLATGVSSRYLRSLQRDVGAQRQIAVWMSEVGGHPDNARVVLRYVAERAGFDPDQGRFTFEGEGDSGLVRFYADPELGTAL